MTIVKKDEIIESGLFAQANESAKAFEKTLIDISNGYKELLKVTKTNILQTDPNSAAGIQKQAEQIKKAKVALTELQKVERTRENLSKRLKVADSDQAKEVAKLRAELQRKNKAVKEEVALNNSAEGSYRKLSIQLNQARAKYKDLAASEKQNTTDAKKLISEITRLDTKLKGIDKTVGQSQRNVGNYSSAFRGLGSALRSVAQAAGVTFGIIGATRLLTGAIGLVREYEKTNAELNGVLNKNKEETIELREAQKSLGETTEFTASEVGELQVAYARLGFEQTQILSITEATLRGATALQADLGETAELVGGTLRAFNLDASEAGRVVDTLVASTQGSALSFDRLKTSLGVVAPVAANANFTLEETAALLGTIVDRNIDASTAGTALRNIFLANAKSGDTFNESLNKISNSANKNKTAVELFGVRTATVATILADSQVKAQQFAQDLALAGGTAEEVAKKQLDTLDGSLKLLNSAWEGYILRLNDATGAGSFLTDAIQFLGKNLSTILDIVGNAVVVFLSYKATVLAVNSSLKLVAFTQKAFGIATAFLGGGLKAATGAMKVFNKVTKANVIGAIVAVVIALVAAFKAFGDEASAASKAQDRFNKASENAAKAVADEQNEVQQLVAVARSENATREQKLEAIRKLNEISPEHLGNITLENINTRETTEAINGYVSALKRKSLEQAISAQRSELVSNVLKEEAKALGDNVGVIDKIASGLSNLSFTDLFKLGTGNAADVDLKNLQNASNDLADTDKKNKDASIAGAQEELAAFDALIAKKLESGEISIDDVISGKGSKGGAAAAKRASTVLEKYRSDLTKTNKLKEKLLGDGSGFNSTPFNKAIDKAEELEEKIKRLEILLKGGGFTFDVEIAKQEDDDLSEFLKRTEAEEKIEQDKLDARAKLNKDFNDALQADLDKELEDQFKKEDELAKKEEERKKSFYDSIDKAAEAFAESERQRSEQAIKRLDDEITKRQQNADFLRGLAQDSSQSAIDNLAFENQKIAELQREKQKEERRAKQAELAIAAVRSYTAALEGGAKPIEALGQTTGGITALLSFINSLPGFYGGTENVANDLAGNKFSNGRDGYLVKVDGKERIMTGMQNAKTKGLSNEELAYAGELYNNGMLTAQSVESSVVLNQNKINTLGIEKAIERGLASIEMPDASIDVNELQGIITKVITHKNTIKKIKTKLRVG